MTHARTVLVVEDDLPFAEFLRAAVESLGHGCVMVASGSDALAAFEESRPDLVFLDLLLPKRDGFKICEDIRRHPAGATVPVIMMTGIYRKAVYEREGLEKAKANEYLLKPFGVREVWRVLERHLGAGVTRLSEPTPPVMTTGTALSETPLACLIATHLAQQSNGVLFVRDTEATFVIYLRDGAPVFARSSDPADRLDRVLVKTGRLTQDQLDSALKAANDSRGRVRLGETLVDRGHVSREQMETALQLQLRLILNRAFQVESGLCLFVAGEHPTEEDVLLTANPREILLRGARSTPLATVRGNLPRHDAVLTRPIGWEVLLAGLNLRDDEARLLQLADGSTTVERFLASAAVAGFDGPRILLGLTCAGLVASTPGRARADVGEETTEWDVDAWRHRPFGAALAMLHRLLATGRLTVRDGEGITKLIDFQRGQIRWVESASPADRLGPMIQRMEIVDAKALDALLEELGDDPRDAALGRLLVDRGALGPSELYWAAVYQAHGAVHSLLGEATTEIEWTPGPIATAVTLPDVPTAELAWNGVRSLDDGTVRELLPPANESLEATGADGGALPLSPSESAVLDRLRGGLSIGRLLEEGDEDARRTALGLLWMGLASARADAAIPPESPVKQNPLRAGTHPDDVPLACDPGVGLDADLDADLVAWPRAEEPAPKLAPRRNTPPRELACDDFLGMLHDEAFLDDEDGLGGADAELLESREAAEPRAPRRPRRLSMPSNPKDAIDLRDSMTDLARRLKEMRPVVSTLRGGLDGNERRVLIDRERMAELFDGLLEAIAATSEIEDLLERWQAEAAAERQEQGEREEQPEPAGSTRG